MMKTLRDIAHELKGDLLLRNFPAMTFLVVAVLHIALTQCSSDYKHLLGWFDAFILATLVVANRYLWSRFGRLPTLIIYALASVPLFGVLLPAISMCFELDRTLPTGLHDSYEFLYTFLRFPQYWILGAVQCLVWIAATLLHWQKAKIAEAGS